MIRKILKWLGIIILSLIILGVLLYFYYKPALPPIITTAQKEIPTHKWHRVEVGDQVISSNGSSYHPFVKKGTTNRLLIFFSGGGVAWDEHTAVHPFELSMLWTKEGYYFKDISPWIMYFLNGILAENDPKNPFNDWHVLFIPYTTGDFHIGNRTAIIGANGAQRTIHFNGRNNTLQSLAWVIQQFPNPEKVLIAGESAGAFGSTFWVPHIAQQYSNSKIYHYADGAMLTSPKFPKAANELWNADWEHNFGYSPTDDLIQGAFMHNGKTLGDQVTFLHSNTLYDEILIQFHANITGFPDEHGAAIADWSEKMRQSTKAIKQAVPNYYYYLTDYQLNTETGKTPHTFSRKNDLFYEVEEDDVLFLDWLTNAVLKDQPSSVGERFLK